MMWLFHGSNGEIEHPDVSFSRKYMDFGRGFYLSEEYTRAATFALRKVDINGGIPFVYKYALNEDILKDWRVKEFPVPDEEWFDYIVANRIGKLDVNEWDMVIGATADERVRNIVNQYIDDPEIFDKAALIERLKPRKYPKQIVIKTQGLLDKLVLIERTTVEVK